MPVMLGPILGPTLGGFLVEYVDWRWVFFLNMPVGVLASCWRAHAAARDADHARRAFRRGRVRAGGGVLERRAARPERSAGKGLGRPGVVGLLRWPSLRLPIFIWWELRQEHPLLNLRLFAIPAFSIGAVVNFVAPPSLFGAIFLLPVFLQNLRGMGAMETGLLLFPQALASSAVTIVRRAALRPSRAAPTGAASACSCWRRPPGRWPARHQHVGRRDPAAAGAAGRGDGADDDAGDDRLAGGGPGQPDLGRLGAQQRAAANLRRLRHGDLRHDPAQPRHASISATLSMFVDAGLAGGGPPAGAGAAVRAGPWAELAQAKAIVVAQLAGQVGMAAAGARLRRLLPGRGVAACSASSRRCSCAKAPPAAPSRPRPPPLAPACGRPARRLATDRVGEQAADRGQVDEPKRPVAPATACCLLPAAYWLGRTPFSR